MAHGEAGNKHCVLPLRRLIRRPAIASAVAVPVVALAAFGAHAELTDSSPPSDMAPTTDSTATSGQSLDAHAIVVNHGDDRYRYALTLKIVQTGADVVDPQNAAVAV